MQADYVARGQQTLQAFNAIDADGDLGAARHIRVVGDDGHAEGLGAESGRDADPPEADHAEDAPAQAPDQRSAGIVEAAHRIGDQILMIATMPRRSASIKPMAWSATSLVP